METPTLDDFMAMNEQLAALASAGVPVDVGLGNRDTVKTLERINAAVARGVSRGATLAEALEATRNTAPPSYMRMMQLAIRSEDLPAALAGATQVAKRVDHSRDTFRLALFYPLFVCLLAYAGLVGLCLYFVPIMGDMVAVFRTKPGPGLRVLQELTATLPVWVGIPPLAFILYFGWRWFRGRRANSAGRVGIALASLPGVSRTIADERRAKFAGLMFALVTKGIPIDEALPLAAGTCGDVGLNAGAHELAAGLRSGKPPSDTSPAAMRFPPFLRWALWHAEASIGRARALEMAAGLYEESARRRTARLRVLLPVLACVLVAGGATLVYALALFVPVVEMLRSLS
jgi:type II secretory pathway component PulF